MSSRPDLQEQYRDGRNLEARIRLHERFSTNPLGLHRWLLAQIDVPADASVLEVGCGVGSFWFTNRDRIPPGWRVTLTDRSPGMVSEAERRLGPRFPNFLFATAVADRLPFPDASFDALFAHFMLYHVEDREQALREMARVVRPGGSLHAATNGARHMREVRALVADARLMTPDAVEAGDAAEFSLENGGDQLRTAFTEVALRPYGDHLVVKDAEPLVASILSTADVQATPARLDAARTRTPGTPPLALLLLNLAG